MHARALPDDGGFTLVETLVAVALLATAAASVLPLFLHASRLGLEARRSPVALAAVSAKLEQLRGLRWSFDASGAPVSDERSDTSVDPPASSGGTGLRPSPAASLDVTSLGYADVLDRFGTPLGPASTTIAGARYLRRWAIARVRGDPDLLLLRACVWSVEQATGPGVACAQVARSRR